MDARTLRQLLEHRKTTEHRLMRERRLTEQQLARARGAMDQLRRFAFEYRDLGSAAARAPASAAFLNDSAAFGTRLDAVGHQQALGLADTEARAEAARQRLQGAMRQKQVVSRLLESAVAHEQRLQEQQASNEVEDQASARHMAQPGTVAAGARP